MIIIRDYEDYVKAMDALDLLYAVEDRTDDENLELLELSSATEDYEIKNDM